MILLSVLNMAFFFLVSVFPSLYLTRYFKLGWFNLLTIPLAVGLPLSTLTSFTGPYFFLDGSLYNPYFQYALLVSNVHGLVGGLTLIALIRLFVTWKPLQRLSERFVRSGGPAKPERMRLSAWVFLGIFAVSFVILTRSFGLINWILDPRQGYQVHRAGAGQWYALCVTTLSVSMALATTYARTTYRMIALVPLYLALIYLLGSKSFIIGFTLFLIIVLAIRRFKYLSPVAAVILSVGAISTITTFVASLGGFGLQQISAYSDYYVNAAMYYRDYLSGKLPLFDGQVMLTSLWGLVPRSLYPGKPYVYGIILIDEYYFPGAAAQTSTPAFATVDMFSDFGWPQVVLSGIFSVPNLIASFLGAMLLPRLQALNLNTQTAHSRFLTYIYLTIISPYFLFYFDFPLNTILFLLVMGTINLTNKLRFAPGGAGRETEAAPSAVQ